MADFLTHVLLSDYVTGKIESRRILEGISKRRALFRLGAQGPDPLYFYNCFPGSGKGALRDLGGRMHDSGTGEFLKSGFDRLKDVSWDDAWIELAVYLAGFICHFTLDRMIHPYVNWASSQWIWSIDGTPVRTTHMAVEISLDVLLWKEKRGTPAYKIRTGKMADIGKEWPESVQKFLIDSFSSIYNVAADKESLRKVLADFYRGHDLLYDPKGWKKRLINWLDTFTGGGVRPPKTPYPVEEDKSVDWANKKKRSWINPYAEGGERRESVDEILDAASTEAANHINSAFARILKREPFDDLFPSLSYSTGLPCEPRLEVRG